MAEFLSLFVEKPLDYTVVPIGRQFGYLFCYNANLEEFRTQLIELQTLRNDVKQRVEAAERQGEVIFETVRNWLAKVDAVSAESRLFAEEEDAVSKRFFNGPLNLKVRHQRSRKAKKKATEFNAIHSDGKDFLHRPVSYAAPPLPIGSVINENEFDFESRKSVFDAIMEAIKDDGVGMIGIWGTGGIGKTTMVERVAKYAREEKLFKEVAMAIVSQPPSVRAIQGEIADRIGLKLTGESEGGRAGQLHQRLLGVRRILIILDDIWERIELREIGVPSPSQHKGCKIILTTRKRDVCEQMRTGKTFAINALSETEALRLFLQTVQKEGDITSEKGELGRNLSKECGGLPIAIVLVARGLVGQDPVCWQNMLIRLRNSDPDHKVIDVIKSSYGNLKREEEKMFFLLCALFPEDYQIRVEFLFEYGIGLKMFEKVDNLDQAAVRAQELALKLKSQCLLLDGYDERFVKMHDVIRDVARAIALSEGKHMFLVPGNKEKMAMSLRYDDIHKLPDALERPQLQILMLDGQDQDFQLHGSFFAGMKNLIVLHMFDVICVRLPQSFASLENLRTLLLYAGSLRDISGIGSLRNLISLRIYSSIIEVLPKEVRELTNLRLLDLTSCDRLKVIYSGVIQNLSRLEVLRMGRNIQWGDRQQEGCSKNASVSELTHLSCLMILEIYIPDASMLPDDVLLFENLTKFQVLIGDPSWKHISASFTMSRQILKLTRLSQNELLKGAIKKLMKKAEYLQIEDISGISVALPSLIGGYGSLKSLIICDCEDVNYVMNASEIGHETFSPQELHLIHLPSFKEISKGKLPSLFASKLEHLELDRLPSLVRLWLFQVESNLTTVKVTSCDKLEYVFDMSSVDCLSKLQKLKVRGCINLQVICASKKQDDDILFPQLRHLELSELQNLTSFSSDFMSQSTLFGEQVNFGALETLNIDNLEKLEKIWHIKTRVESFFQLKVLKLIRCPELLVVFPPQVTSGLRYLEELCIEKCDKLETLLESNDVRLAVGDEMVLFPQLLTLKLISLPNLTTFFDTTSQNITQAMDRQLSTFFPKLEKLELEDIGHLFLTVYPLDLDNGLEALKELRVKDNNASTLPQVLATIPKLKILELQNLTSLNFSICNGLECVLISSGVRFLVHLESLTVSDCENMESIVGDASSEPNFEKSIEFSRLHALELDNLHSLAKFYSGECALKFPCLEELSIIDCPKLKTFASVAREMTEPGPSNFMPEALFGQQVSFGRLSSLTLERLESVEDIWHSGHLVMTMGELENLGIEGCDRLLKLFPSNLVGGLQNLECLLVESCRSLEHVFAVEDHLPLLTKLSSLTLSDLPKLKQLWWNENGRESFGIPRLGHLTINNCPALQFIFNPSVAERLDTLSYLGVENCSSMVEIVAEKPDKKMEFPCITYLRLVNLPCFKVNQNVEFPRLRMVIMDRCFNVRERCKVDVEKELARPVKFFESFVEWSNKGGPFSELILNLQTQMKKRKRSEMNPANLGKEMKKMKELQKIEDVIAEEDD